MRSPAWRVAIGVAIAIGVGVRVHNAIHYPLGWGFDSEENWRYIVGLMRSWRLPAPDAGWSTAHPPFFYYLSALLCKGLRPSSASEGIIAIRLLSSSFGVATIALAVALVRRAAPGEPLRAWLAGGLLLFLPVHIYMSAMLSEEILTAFFTSLAIGGVAWELARPEPTRRPLLRAGLLGLVAGLAWLTKLTGILVVVAAAGSLLVIAASRSDLQRAGRRVALLVGVAAIVGGWFYARNLVEYGYLYPHGLPQHQEMFDMPPGKRQVSDYLRIPIATFVEPQLLNEDLLRSVWGGTYVTIFFDGHRHFLPRKNRHVRRAGTALLLLGLLPTAAFLIGIGRGLRRLRVEVRSPDTPLLFLSALTLAGYVAFTLRNPWFAVIKGSFLLGLALPFSYYASEVLAGWMRGSRRRTLLLGTWLLVLWLGSATVFTFDTHLWEWKIERIYGPGLRWVDPSTVERPAG